MPNPLREIRKFTDLVRYLETELEWPVQAGNFDDLTFEYIPAELGLREEDAVTIKKIYQLRPLVSGQPWGIFFVEFEKKKLPVVVLRRILGHLVIKKRRSANKADQAAWNPRDLLFISAFGDETTDQREIAFAHFHEQEGDLPTLQVLGWDGADTVLKLEHVADQLREKLHWPQNPGDHAGWRAQWSKVFRHRIGHTIKTSGALAERLAALARGIRDRCTLLMAVESEHGPLTKLFKAFQAALIHDLTEETFADTYAQTITYGLLTAAINRTDMSGGTEATYVKADDLTLMVRVTSPFLKEMLETFLTVGGRRNGVQFDELGIHDVVELLRGEETDLPAILRDFGNKTSGEDPVIHFYEHFLSAYNKKLKIQRGVFYTPLPVVSYIVRSVHELLQTEFGLEDGLASTVTWGEILKKHPGLNLPPLSDEPADSRTVSPDEPFVQILDPATGTATFLVEAVDVIYQTLTAKWKKQGRMELEIPRLWNEYVPKHLLPRLHGYELLAAPYAIAHLKLGLKLTETGYHFGSAERARIYLTNALEPKVTQLPQIGFAPLAHEAQAVNEIKWYKRFTVVIGNPPYAGNSANASVDENGALTFIGRLIEDYKKLNNEPVKEKQIKWLQDDYVKFIRIAQHTLRTTRVGIWAYITNHSYLDNPTFRGMRWNLWRDFRCLFLLDLHGNQKKKEKCPDGSEDQNVFDIIQGVGLLIATKVSPATEPVAEVRHSNLWGIRMQKYDYLSRSSIKATRWEKVSPAHPFFLFVPQNLNLRAEQERAWRITDVIIENNVGFVTARDAFAIAFDDEELRARIIRFRSATISDSQLAEDYGLKNTTSWDMSEARTALRNNRNWERHFATCTYRPFDFRHVYYSDDILERPVFQIQRHMLAGRNLGIAVGRAGQVIDQGTWNILFVTRGITEFNLFRRGGNNLLPLYLYDDANESQQGLGVEESKRLNLSPIFLRALAERLGLKQVRETGLPLNVSAEDIFHYAYSVFHSPGYRSRYAEFLKIDFPRLPLTGNLELFRALARLGGELTVLHLLESPKLDKPITEYIGGHSPVVGKASWSKNTVWLDKAQTTGFQGVREEVWNFHIGGYQVCEKWLKDRKGRNLTADDLTHYQKIIVALSETIRLMKEIDALIEKYGGWPIK